MHMHLPVIEEIIDDRNYTSSLSVKNLDLSMMLLPTAC
jgi:hypothetical protein